MLLTPCLGSLSTCQRWCWRSHLRAVSSTQCRLCWWNSNTVTVRGLTNTYWTRVGGLRLTLLAAVEGSSQVGVYHSFPAFRGRVLCWAAELTSSIVHQEVYPAVLLQHRRYEGLHLPRGEWKQDAAMKSGDHALITEHLVEAEDVCRLTSSSFRMLHVRGVTRAGLEGGIFCLISWAAASNLSAFLLEITTLQPEDKKSYKTMITAVQIVHFKMQFLWARERWPINKKVIVFVMWLLGNRSPQDGWQNSWNLLWGNIY